MILIEADMFLRHVIIHIDLWGTKEQQYPVWEMNSAITPFYRYFFPRQYIWHMKQLLIKSVCSGVLLMLSISLCEKQSVFFCRRLLHSHVLTLWAICRKHCVDRSSEMMSFPPRLCVWFPLSRYRCECRRSNLFGLCEVANGYCILPALAHNKTNPLSDQESKLCGSTTILRDNGDLVFRASFLACHVYSQVDLFELWLCVVFLFMQNKVCVSTSEVHWLLPATLVCQCTNRWDDGNLSTVPFRVSGAPEKWSVRRTIWRWLLHRNFYVDMYEC